jgi:branched-chain amino acid transport system substrate-binding protein
MQVRRRGLKLAGVVVGLALIAAACGSDDSGGGSDDTGGSGGGGSVRGVTATEVTVGGVAALTSPQGGYPGADTGAEARFNRANEEGGVAGRTINWIGVADDGEDANRNLDLVRDAVNEDEVFAIVPSLGQGLLPASSDFLVEEQVPFFGWGFMPGFCGPEWGFGFNGCIIPPDKANQSTIATLIDGGQIDEGGTIAIQAWDGSGGQEGLKVQTEAAKSLGLDVVYSKATLPILDSADFTPFAQELVTSAGGQAPDAIVINGLFGNTIGLTGSLRAAGYEGPIMNYLTYVPGFLEANPDAAAALDGAYVNTQYLPQEFGGPAIDQMVEDLEAIGAEPVVSLGVAIGYWSADIFLSMLEAVGEDLTPERFVEVANGPFQYEQSFNPPGIGPIEFPAGHGEPAPCAAMVQVNGLEYEPIVPLTCYENIPM